MAISQLGIDGEAMNRYTTMKSALQKTEAYGITGPALLPGYPFYGGDFQAVRQDADVTCTSSCLYPLFSRC